MTDAVIDIMKIGVSDGEDAAGDKYEAVDDGDEIIMQRSSFLWLQHGEIYVNLEWRGDMYDLLCIKWCCCDISRLAAHHSIQSLIPQEASRVD